MDKPKKKDEMRAAGKKRLEEFRMKRQHKTGPVKAAEIKNSSDAQISSSDLSLRSAGDICLLDIDADPLNDEPKVSSNEVEEQELTSKDGAVTELANNLSQQEEVLNDKQLVPCTARHWVNEASVKTDSSAIEMTAEKNMLEEKLAAAQRLLEQRDTEYREREEQLLADAQAATRLVAEVRAQFASDLNELTRTLKICHTENEHLEAKVKASVSEADQLRQQLSDNKLQLQKSEDETAPHERGGVDLEKRVQALLEEKHLQEVKVTAAQIRCDEEEKTNHLLSSSLQQVKEELHESRNRESVLVAQRDSARTQLLSIEKEKGQLLLEFEAASSAIQNIEQERVRIESDLEKEMQEKASVLAQKDQYVSQLKEHKETASQLVKENEYLEDQVKILKSEIHSLQGDREVTNSVFRQQILQLTQDFDRIFQEADLLRNKLLTTSNENLEAQTELESVKNQLAEIVGVKLLASEELVSAKEYVQAALEENKRISAEVDAWRNSAEQHLSENVQLKADSQLLTSELCTTRHMLADCEKELLSCQQSLGEVVKVRGQLENSLQTFSLQSEEWQREKTELLSEVETLKANLVTVSSEKLNLDGNLKAAKEQLLEMLTESQRLREELLELNTKLEISVGDVKRVEEIYCLSSEIELLRQTIKEATDERDSLGDEVMKLHQVNEELKEETCTLQTQLQVARNEWQDVVHSKAEQDVEVEQLKQELLLINETVVKYVQQIEALEQENSFLRMHISKAESTSLELEQAVRQVLPSESPDASPSSQSAYSGVHLASCVRKLIHEFEARAKHAGHDVQVQTHVSDHESSLLDGSVQLLQPLSQLTSLKESEKLADYERAVLSTLDRISSSDLQVLRDQLRETVEENSWLKDVVLSKSQEVFNLTEQLSELKEKLEAAADKYEEQVNQMLSDQSALRRELVSFQKKCEEQGEMIQSYLGAFKQVYGSLTTFKNNLYTELEEAPCTESLQETIICSELDSLVGSCNDLVNSLSERSDRLREQLRHAALKNVGLENLAQSFEDQVMALHLEIATAVRSNSEMQSKLLDLRGYIERLETSEAKNQALVKEYENEQTVFRQRIFCLLEMFDMSSVAGTCDLSEQGLKDGTAWLLNQLEERSKAFVDFTTLDSQAKIKLVVELEAKVGQLQDSLSRATADADEVRSDFKLLAQKFDTPSMGALDFGWDDSVALSVRTDVAGSLAASIGSLVSKFQYELQDRLEVQQKLQKSQHELQKVLDEHSSALQSIQILQGEMAVQRRKEEDLTIKLEGALSRILDLDEKQHFYEGNENLQSDLASLQMAASCPEAAMRAEVAAHSEVQKSVEAFVLQAINKFFAALASSSDATTEILQDLLRDLSFSPVSSGKIPNEDIENLRQTVLESAIEYNATVQQRTGQHDDDHQKLEMALQAETQRFLESAAHHSHEMKALLQQTEALNNHVLGLQSEIASLKSERLQGEQRLAAAKDKLALAISRGKALSHQRDALRQSLAEKSGELDLLVATQSEQLKEKDVSLEANIKDLTAAACRAELAEQELAGVKEAMFAVEQQLLGYTTTFAELETAMKEVSLPDDVKTKELSAIVTWICRSFHEIQQELAAAVKESETIKEGAALLELQLKAAHDEEAILVAKLEAERDNLTQQWSSEVEKCMRAQALLFEEASQNASAKDVLQAELDLTSEKLAAELALRLKLHSDFEVMVVKAQDVIPNSIKAELWGTNVSFPSSFDAVTNSILTLYKDSASEVDKLEEKVSRLMIQQEQFKEMSDELTYSTQQVKNLQQVVADKDLEISGLAARMEEAAATMAHQQEEISAMSQQLHKLKHNLDEAVNEKTSLQTQLTDMEHRLSTTREKLGMAVRKGKALKLEHDTSKHSLGEKIAEAEALAGRYVQELHSKDSLLQQLQLKLSAVLDEKQVLHDEKLVAVSQLVNETAATRSLMEETTALRACKLQQEHELESLKETLSAHSTELKTAQLAASQFSSQVADLQVTNSDLSEDLAAVKLEMLKLRQERSEVGSLKSCINIGVKSMKSLTEELDLLQAKHGDTAGTATVSLRGSDSLRESQESYIYTEDFMQTTCQLLVERVQYLATWAQQMRIDKENQLALYREEAKEGTANIRLLRSQLSSLKQQVLSKDREATELKEEREHLQVSIQDIQTLSKKALEEKGNTIKQMNHRLAQLESKVKDLLSRKDVDEAKIRVLEATKVEHQHELQMLDSKLHSAKQRADEDAKSLKHSEAELATIRELLSARNEDLEAHMQALCEAESQVDTLSHRVKELEGALRQKHASLQSLESSRSKAIAKLNTNYKKLNDVLHQSEELLALSENLQLDLEKRDAEILRLAAQLADSQSQVTSMPTSHQEKSVILDQLQTKLMGILMKAFNDSIPQSTVERTGQVTSEHAMLSHLEDLESLLENLLLEVETLKATASTKDNQLRDLLIELQVLSADKVALEGTVQSQQLQLQSLLVEAGSTSVSRNEILSVEIEDKGQRTKRALGVQVPNAAAPHVRGTRKLPMSDVVLDVDLENQPLYDLEDKGHDYKSLAMAKFMPRVMRPAAERLDGFCVAGGRLLMKQPSARFGLIIYWIFIHLWITSALVL